MPRAAKKNVFGLGWLTKPRVTYHRDVAGERRELQAKAREAARAKKAADKRGRAYLVELRREAAQLKREEKRALLDEVKDEGYRAGQDDRRKGAKLTPYRLELLTAPRFVAGLGTKQKAQEVLRRSYMQGQKNPTKRGRKNGDWREGLSAAVVAQMEKQMREKQAKRAARAAGEPAKNPVIRFGAGPYAIRKGKHGYAVYWKQPYAMTSPFETKAAAKAYAVKTWADRYKERAYKNPVVRFIKPNQVAELVNLYHLARVPLSGKSATRYDRMLWASKEFAKLHPEVSAGGAYKDLDAQLSQNPSPGFKGYPTETLKMLLDNPFPQQVGPAEKRKIAAELVRRGKLGASTAAFYAKKGKGKNPGGYESIKPGSRVTIVDRFGKTHAGRAVMLGPAGWVLNMGGRHGTPAIASPQNVVKVTGGKSTGSLAERRLVGNTSGKEREKWIKQVLANDEASSDAELLAYFLANGLTEQQAKHWVSKRDAYLRGMNPRAAGNMGAKWGYGVYSQDTRSPFTSNKQVSFFKTAKEAKAFADAHNNGLKAAGKWYSQTEPHYHVRKAHQGGEAPGVNPRALALDGNLFMFEKRPASGSILTGSGRIVTRGAPVEILQKGRGGRVLIKADYYGTPYYGWANRDRLKAAAANPKAADKYSVIDTVTKAVVKTYGSEAAARADQKLWNQYAEAHHQGRRYHVKLSRTLTAGNGKGRRRNPLADAAALSEKFHGRPASTRRIVNEPVHRHKNLMEIGPLVRLVLDTVTGGVTVLTFDTEDPRKVVTLACSERDPLTGELVGKQLYFKGGDQEINLKGLGMNTPLWVRDFMELGRLHEFQRGERLIVDAAGKMRTAAPGERAAAGETEVRGSITYQARKGFDNFELIDYWHRAGEETGNKHGQAARPIVSYDYRNKRLSLIGGQYRIDEPGIIN